MNNNKKGIASLIWVVFVDSMGWGIAFSIFAALFFKSHSNIIPDTVSETSRYMLYEFLLAIYSVFMFFFAPVLGGIADRYGRKPGLKISMLGLTMGFILSALGCYWSSIWFLILGRIISGMTAGSLSVAQAAAVDISTPQNKSFYLSILMLSNCLGFSLGPILGGALMHFNVGPIGASTFLIGAIMSAIGFLSIQLFFKETYVPQKSKDQFNLIKDFANIKIAFSKPLLSNYLQAVLFSMVAFGLFFSDIPVFLSRYFPAQNSSTDFILSFEAIIFSLTLMFGGKYLFDYFEKIKVVFFTLVIQLLAYLFISLGIQSFALNVLLFTCISAFTGLMYIALLTLISDTTESDWQGRVMGVVAALSSVTWGVGPLLTGGLNFYGAGIAFLFCALLIIISILALRKSLAKNKDIKFASASQ
ncbi:MFS transporter [Legionella hackeliae]|uniref:Major facilitator superfamily (MFS) profile domain-containing protein n=1 Tax=Legionella hackeliae TaxID=449 RepID=A0A0A8USA0_LEGHA|nr:MFS transporter [Legionella hackeliae]KTD10115.1 transporter of the major facilitator superfamily (MFS) [Legionella hackeliae]CEK09604.1 membrane protein of unknown function [Legionella hackeliae]STX49519.1 transporter of the major facilitator superfamily (MFS) [Legionella hackeliae]